MARQFGGDLYDLDNLGDEDLRELVVQQLQEYPELDASWIDVDVRDGHVTLSGSVGTDQEVQIAASVVQEVLGVEHFTNDLVVDELHRGQLPEAADDAIAHDAEVDDQRGEGGQQHTDTASHLVEDLAADSYGTHDMQQAIRDGTSYEPPDRPTGGGYGSRENH